MTSLSLLTLTFSGVLTMHSFEYAGLWLPFAVILWISSMFFWFRDIISEGTYLGNHTLAVQRGLNMGVGLFIISEALFFLGIFWSFFHSAVGAPIEVGVNWPPVSIDTVNPFELPLLNSLLLLSSGFTITHAHHSIIKGIRGWSIYGVFFTVVLALYFTILQWTEYADSSFTLTDSAYGSCFYFGTGFHGLHVIIGTAFIAVGLWRLLDYHFTISHHLGLESSILYWHFVDIVWLFLFVSVYYWGS